MDSSTRHDLTAHAIPEVHHALMETYPDRFLDRRERFLLYREYVDLLADGEKTTTVRYVDGKVDVPALKVLPLHVSFRDRDDTVEVGRVEVTALEVKPFGELTAADAERDGFGSRAELQDALEDIYGDIPDDHPVSIYHLSVVGPRDSLREQVTDAGG